jgi:hypothetical protein
MSHISTAYFVEQAVIAVTSLFMLGGAGSQLLLHRKKENSNLVKPVHKAFMYALLLAGILEMIWSIDPQGIWKIHTAISLAFIKDFVIISLSFCGQLWLDIYCRAIFQSLGRINLSQTPLWISSGTPLLLTIVVQVSLTILAITTGRQNPRSYFILFVTFVILCWSIGVTIALIYVLSIRKKAGLNFDNNDQKRVWMRMIRLVMFLWLIVIVAVALSVNSLLNNRTTTLQEAQVIADPTRYIPYTFYVFHVSAGILVYLGGKLPSVQQSQSSNERGIAVVVRQIETAHSHQKQSSKQ